MDKHSFSSVQGPLGLPKASYRETAKPRLIADIARTASGFKGRQLQTCAALAATCVAPDTKFTYDRGSAGPGNITSQIYTPASGPAVALTYTYPVAGQPQPHAVASISGIVNGVTNPAYTYDGNGNMLTRGNSTSTITWASYNYPTEIVGNDGSTTGTLLFGYGPIGNGCGNHIRQRVTPLNRRTI